MNWKDLSGHPITPDNVAELQQSLNIRSKTIVWILLAIPFALICARFAQDAISYGQVLHQTGLWSAGLLIAALSISPLRHVLASRRWFRAVIPHRRALGVASFMYAALHTGVYLERKWGTGLIQKEGLEPWLAAGWIALAVFLALAITSNNSSVRAMGRSWKRLHRLVYAATVLIFVHWLLSAFDPTLGIVFVAVLVALQLPRLAAGSRRK